MGEGAGGPHLDDLPVASILGEDVIQLERMFSEDEVVQALRFMCGDKAPDPDVFTMAFFEHCWTVLREDVMAIFSEFYDKGYFFMSLNARFVNLVPKKGGATNVRDLKPISLVSSV